MVISDIVKKLFNQKKKMLDFQNTSQNCAIEFLNAEFNSGLLFRPIKR